MDRCPTHCRTVYLVRTNWRADPGAGVTRNSRRSARDSGTRVLPTNDARSPSVARTRSLSAAQKLEIVVQCSTASSSALAITE